MKVLLVTNGYPPTAFGGVEVYTQSLAQALQQRGNEVVVFCRESNMDLPDYHVQEEMQEDIPVLRIVNDFKQMGAFDATYHSQEIENKFEELLERERPDLIHFNHLIALSVGLPAIASQFEIPTITTLHDYWYICHRVRLQDWRDQRCGGPLQGGDCYRCVVTASRWFRLRRRLLLFGKFIMPPKLRRKIREWGWLPSASSVTASTAKPNAFELRRQQFSAALRYSEQILVPSNHIREVIHHNGFQDLSIDVLPLGMQLPQKEVERRPLNDPIRIGFTGTLIPDKGVHVLLKAFTATSSPNLELHIHGPSDADSGYTKQLSRLAKGDKRIHFHGAFSVEQRDEIYQSLDVLVLPSLFQETYSLVARESLLNKTPVIAADVGALPEIIVDRQNGFLFPPGDSNALALLLSDLAENPARVSGLDVPGPVPILSVEDHIEELLKRYSHLA